MSSAGIIDSHWRWRITSRRERMVMRGGKDGYERRKDRKRVRMTLRLDIEIGTIDQLQTRALRISVW